MVNIRFGSARVLLALAVLAQAAAAGASQVEQAVANERTPACASVSEQTTNTDALNARPLPAGVYRAGAGVMAPTLLKSVYPQYTAEAMRAEIQGFVRLDLLVGVDGNVDDARLVCSLDPVNGLDRAAVEAAQQWRFEPGTKDGVPVPVMITIDSTFSMSAGSPAKSRRHTTR